MIIHTISKTQTARHRGQMTKVLHQINYEKKKGTEKTYKLKFKKFFLENITVSEISQPEKDKYHMISLTCGI